MENSIQISILKIIKAKENNIVSYTNGKKYWLIH